MGEATPGGKLFDTRDRMNFATGKNLRRPRIEKEYLGVRLATQLGIRLVVRDCEGRTDSATRGYASVGAWRPKMSA